MDEFAEKWIKYSKMDLEVAERELYLTDDQDNILTPIVCFHAQQAVEKVLKAYLIKNEIDFQKIHNLEILRKMASKVDEEFEKIDFGELNYYGVATRYPDGLLDMPSFDNAQDVFEIAKGICEFTYKKMGN